jgi:hypothetical protein
VRIAAEQQRLFDSALASCLHHMSKTLCPAGTAQSQAASSLLSAASLCTPLLTARLSSAGVDGDEYSLHALWLFCSQAASPPQLLSFAEYAASAMYDLLRGDEDDDEEDEALQSGQTAAYTAHASLASLAPSSFASVGSTAYSVASLSLLPCSPLTLMLALSVVLPAFQYLSILLHLVPLLLCRLPAPSSKPAHLLYASASPRSPFATFHWLLVLYSHLLQLYLLASAQPLPLPLLTMRDDTGPAQQSLPASQPKRTRAESRKANKECSCRPLADPHWSASLHHSCCSSCAVLTHIAAM